MERDRNLFSKQNKRNEVWRFFMQNPKGLTLKATKRGTVRTAPTWLCFFIYGSSFIFFEIKETKNKTAFDKLPAERIKGKTALSQRWGTVANSEVRNERAKRFAIRCGASHLRVERGCAVQKHEEV